MKALERLPFYPWLVVGTVCVGNFMGQTDASIVQLAMPAFEDSFDAPLGAVSWVAVGYVLAFAAALPAFARLAEMAGRKTIYLVGFALFGAFSAACALAPNLLWLIAFRALLGIGGAMLGANSVVIIVTAAGPERRGKALGIQAAAQAVGLSAGPALGGVLLGAFGWRSIFWIAVPAAVIGTLLGWLIIPKTAKRSPDARFDVVGALLLAPALAGLLLAITEVRAWGLSAPMIACLVAAPIFFAAFVWREMTMHDPLVDLRLFRRPVFTAGSLGILLSYAMLYAIFFAMSFALVRGYHDSPSKAGLELTVVPVALGLTAPFAGGLSDRRRRLVMLIGMGACVASALALTRLLTGTAASLPGVLAGLALFGARPRSSSSRRTTAPRWRPPRPKNPASPAASSTSCACSARASASPPPRRRLPGGSPCRPARKDAPPAYPRPHCSQRFPTCLSCWRCSPRSARRRRWSGKRSSVGLPKRRARRLSPRQREPAKR